MFDGLVQNFVLKAKAQTGASGELVIWAVVTAALAVFAVVFLSVGAYVWLASLYGSAIAGLAVGGFHALVALAAALRCVALRHRNTALALAEMKAAEKRAAWWSDPAVLAIGYEAAKLIGWRKLTPLITAGVLAAALGAERSGRGERGGHAGKNGSK